MGCICGVAAGLAWLLFEEELRNPSTKLDKSPSALNWDNKLLDKMFAPPPPILGVGGALNPEDVGVCGTPLLYKESSSPLLLLMEIWVSGGLKLRTNGVDGAAVLFVAPAVDNGGWNAPPCCEEMDVALLRGVCGARKDGLVS